jgi:phytoene dehydrogenase-like protein
LIVEARDRIGGRTFSTEFDGQQWDIGGTWMHWTMPHVFNELVRYGLVEQLKMTKPVNDKKAYMSLKCSDGGIVTLTPEEEVGLAVISSPPPHGDHFR